MFHWIEYIFAFSIFEQLELVLKNRFALKFLTALKYYLSFRILNNLRLLWNTKSALGFFIVLKYFRPFGIFKQLPLALKTELALKSFNHGGGHPPRLPASCADAQYYWHWELYESFSEWTRSKNFIVNPLSPAKTTFHAELCNPTIRQAIELESCSNPLRIQQVL